MADSNFISFVFVYAFIFFSFHFHFLGSHPDIFRLKTFLHGLFTKLCEITRPIGWRSTGDMIAADSPSYGRPSSILPFSCGPTRNSNRDATAMITIETMIITSSSPYYHLDFNSGALAHLTQPGTKNLAWAGQSMQGSLRWVNLRPLFIAGGL
jgi:hypothetical protein